MLRVLMILEDYGELMFLQTVLKKIGFDVDAIQNPNMMANGILKLNPDVLIMTAYGRRVNGLELSKSVKRLRGLPHLILIRNSGSAPDPDPNIEGWVESPIVVPSLLQVIGEICGVGKGILEEKFQKLQAREAEEEKQRKLSLGGSVDQPMLEKSGKGEELTQPQQEPSGSGSKSDSKDEGMRLKPATLSDSDRKAKYQKFLQANPSVESVFTRKLVQTEVENLRKAQVDGADELERQRKLFVEELFKKKS